MSNALNPILTLTARYRAVDRKKTLTGPDYVWPFGNFRHMFAESRALSHKWRKEYGDIYRIWTGLYSERNRKVFDPLLANNVAVKHIARIQQEAAEFVSSIATTRVDGGSSEETMIIKAAGSFLPFTLNETTSIFFGPLSDEEKRELWDVCLAFMGIARKDQTELPITRLWRDVEAGNLSKDELLQTLTESTVFNLEPTSHALIMTIFLISDNQAFQDDLVAEFDANRSDITRYLGRKDTLLHYAFLEAVRLQPVLPFTLPEAASVDKELSGYLIPKGTSVIADSYGINVRNPFWGPDATSYRPSRFSALTPSEIQRNLSMFGFGARKCLGQFFADKQVRAVVYHLFDRYKVTCSDYSGIAPGIKVDKTEYVDRFGLEFLMQARGRKEGKEVGDFTSVR
ncbi:cytochrome P450 [Aspergillus nidulans var. acristatus]